MPPVGRGRSQESDEICALSLERMSTFSHQESFLVKTQEELPSLAVAAGWGGQVTTFLTTAVRAKCE